ncbi:tripartite tricarboxylate transporter TctB family protein [Streptomyces johnsoniae]|uniref:Tripartite tricarboxylate transporter TctB family protein n=1 Tax=Streptomyces johnsoniae TaxID=3075532 RepID=A0ABU2SCW2_9ACTN|nr:tripartite tricarboxylate transporter TctB family protein [Streptomyces sp. DSM 41886]MDT0446506.1 tripartite tricarboxylate transporter TctB family protein [Streptomyces sp. DSM 41886]
MSATAERDGTRAPDPEGPEGPEGADGPEGPAPAPAGRGELAVVALLLGLGAFLTHGTVTMTVPSTAGSPGPRFFPVIVIILTFSLAAALAFQILRRPRSAAAPPADAPAAGHPRTYTDWRAVGIVVAAFAAFIVLLTPAGWLLSAALLFWGVSYALDGKRPLFDAGVALAVSAAFQLAFSAGLGLNLPAGVLEGAF